MRPVHKLVIVLGQGSLGAFVLHVYAVVLLTHLPIGDGLLTNTVLQLLVIVGTAGLLNAMSRERQASPVLRPSHAMAA